MLTSMPPAHRLDADHKDRTGQPQQREVDEAEVTGFRGSVISAVKQVKHGRQYIPAWRG